jgi:hypothetical protein
LKRSLTIIVRNLMAEMRVDEMREREADAELRGEQPAEFARAEHPQLRAGVDLRLQQHALGDVIGRQRTVHQSDQIGDLLRENVAAVVVAGSDCLCGAHIAARRTANAEVDAVWKQRFEHHELLGDLERAVVRQHHAA